MESTFGYRPEASAASRICALLALTFNSAGTAANVVLKPRPYLALWSQKNPVLVHVPRNGFPLIITGAHEARINEISVLSVT